MSMGFVGIILNFVVVKVEALSMCGLAAMGGVVITLSTGLQLCLWIVVTMKVMEASVGDYGSDMDIKRQSGLSAGIDHEKASRSLKDVIAYIPAAEANHNSALQRLREHDVKQLMLPIHQSEDQVVLGETSLSFALSVAHSRVKRIRKNVAAQQSALVDVWVPLVEPLFVENLMGAAVPLTEFQSLLQLQLLYLLPLLQQAQFLLLL
uniref:Uncharacterized protein n=1 Tax=Tanacetum cinerariifolium TaxID=118510 RepID=A0A6L2JUP6_TANCI|nr:hypothetical protein [Tanacetum cinerariifolium]